MIRNTLSLLLLIGFTSTLYTAQDQGDKREPSDAFKQLIVTLLHPPVDMKNHRNVWFKALVNACDMELYEGEDRVGRRFQQLMAPHCSAIKEWEQFLQSLAADKTRLPSDVIHGLETGGISYPEVITKKILIPESVVGELVRTFAQRACPRKKNCHKCGRPKAE